MVAMIVHKIRVPKRVQYCVSIVFLALLLTACQNRRTVKAISTYDDATVQERIALSDGELIFLKKEHNSVRTDIYAPEPVHAEKTVYTYQDIVDFLQCDLISVFREANVAERCIPTEDCFFTEGLRLTESETWKCYNSIKSRTYELEKGTVWGGEGFDITVPDEEYGFLGRKVWMCVNLEGQYLGFPVKMDIWDEEPNSMVGEIPVFTNYCRHQKPSIGGYELDEFFAFFHISGYTYALLTEECTQQEFVDMLLAIINHYGAYPET